MDDRLILFPVQVLNEVYPIERTEEQKNNQLRSEIKINRIDASPVQGFYICHVEQICNVEVLAFNQVPQGIKVGPDTVEIVERKPVEEVEEDLIEADHRDEKSGDDVNVLFITFFQLFLA